MSKFGEGTVAKGSEGGAVEKGHGNGSQEGGTIRRKKIPEKQHDFSNIKITMFEYSVNESFLFVFCAH